MTIEKYLLYIPVPRVYAATMARDAGLEAKRMPHITVLRFNTDPAKEERACKIFSEVVSEVERFYITTQEYDQFDDNDAKTLVMRVHADELSLLHRKIFEKARPVHDKRRDDPFVMEGYNPHTTIGVAPVPATRPRIIWLNNTMLLARKEGDWKTMKCYSFS